MGGDQGGVVVGEEVVAEPQRSAGGEVGVGRAHQRDRALRVGLPARCVCEVGEVPRACDKSMRPSVDVHEGGEVLALGGVAAISEDELLDRVAGLARPGDEVVHLGAGGCASPRKRGKWNAPPLGSANEWHSCAVRTSTIIARVLNGDRLECQVVSPAGKRLTLSGTTSDVEPRSTGRRCSSGNRAFIHNAWAFAKFTYLKVNLPSEEEQEGAEKRAKSHHKVAEWITDLC
jgi:hypothetical protein